MFSYLWVSLSKLFKRLGRDQNQNWKSSLLYWYIRRRRYIIYPGLTRAICVRFLQFIFNRVLVIQQPLYLFVTRLSTNTSSLRTRWQTKNEKKTKWKCMFMAKLWSKVTACWNKYRTLKPAWYKKRTNLLKERATNGSDKQYFCTSPDPCVMYSQCLNI